jgi:uncharacterized Fe-S center protein
MSTDPFIRAATGCVYAGREKTSQGREANMVEKKVYKVRGGCVICCTCQMLCPVDAVSMDAEGAHIDPDVCIGCGKCMANCPGEAIEPVEEETKGNSE